jgi:diaminopimelate epimerase
VNLVLLTKHHGLGNDFLVALHGRNPGLAPDADVARSLCDRRLGVGADGLLYGLEPEHGGDLRMVLLNSDGSRAEISGNGLRCLGQACLLADGRAAGSLKVETDAGLRSLDAVATDDPLVALVTADMGAVTEGPAVPAAVVDFPHEGAMGLGIGNPHLVFHVDRLDGLDPAVVGPPIEAAVAGGVNVHLLLLEAPDTIRLVHWERGAGVTAACGSGASVSAVAARRWGLVGDRVTVHMPGGAAEVDVLGHAGSGETVRLSGPATYVAEVTTP